MTSSFGARNSYANVSKVSIESHYRRPRPRIADEVFVTSSSILYFGDLSSRSTQTQTLPIFGNFGFVTLRSVLFIGESHEIQEVSCYAEKEGGDNSTDSEDHNYETLDDVALQNNGSICDEDSDSFESDISESNCYVKTGHEGDIGDKQLPEPPASQNIYGISKIAEVAGKKMLEIGRSLRKIRKGNNTVGNERLLTTEVASNKPTVASQQKQEPEQKVTSSQTPTIAMQKVQSAVNLSGRKTWTLRKFKRSMSSSSAPSTSTFYLSSPVEIPNDSTDPPASNGHRHSADLREGSKLPNDMESSRLSGSISLGKLRPLLTSGRRGTVPMRPNSPPPLPPTHPASEAAKKLNKKERDSSNTSWYTECGLFDQPGVSWPEEGIRNLDSKRRRIMEL